MSLIDYESVTDEKKRKLGYEDTLRATEKNFAVAIFSEKK